jgi:hypothetical protein
VRKLFICLMAPLFVAATLVTVGCDTGEECSSTTTEWTCDGDLCTCDDGGDSCTHPDDTDTDDADNCDNLCEVCLD